MRIFRDMELVEQLGSGIPRILKSYGKENFYFSDNYVRMIFPSLEKVKSGNRQNVVENVVENETKILRPFEGKQHFVGQRIEYKIRIDRAHGSTIPQAINYQESVETHRP